MTGALPWLKFGFLAAFVPAVPLYYSLAKDLPYPAFCKCICPAGPLEGVAGYLADMNMQMSCATDGEGDPGKEIVWGTATLSQTVVLNRRGEVVYNSVKSVTPEALEALYEEAAK